MTQKYFPQTLDDIDLKKLKAEDRTFLLELLREESRWNGSNMLGTSAIYNSTLALILSSVSIFSSIFFLLLRDSPNSNGSLLVYILFILLFADLHLWYLTWVRRIHNQNTPIFYINAKTSDKYFEKLFNLHFGYRKS